MFCEVLTTSKKIRETVRGGINRPTRREIGNDDAIRRRDSHIEDDRVIVRIDSHTALVSSALLASLTALLLLSITTGIVDNSSASSVVIGEFN
jgi:hypothetical protein